ncbi:MAG: DUF6345 domain-containing protein, partial [Limisphaerales bacterium]
VHLDGDTYSTASYGSVPPDTEAKNVVTVMRSKGWKPVFNKHDNNLFVQELRRNDQNYGGGEIFTEATIGIFMGHGSYGTDLDYSPGASGSYQTYLPSGNPNETQDNAWLRMCQFGFGGSLKWMVIDACFFLTDSNQNFSSMVNAGGIPLKTTHLICSAITSIDLDATLEQRWAKNIMSTTNTIATAWFNAGHAAYQAEVNNPDTIIFRVAGYPECLADTLTNNVAPYNPSSAPGNLDKRDFQVNP